jgi:hypothetical protein
VGKHHGKLSFGKIEKEIIILEWILGKYTVRMADGWNWFRFMSKGGLCY